MKYDSKTKKLSFATRYPSIPRCPVSLTAELDLSGLTNKEQQRLVSVAKLVSSYVQGQNILVRPKTPRVNGKEGEFDTHPSLLERATTIMGNTQQPEEAKAESTTVPSPVA